MKRDDSPVAGLAHGVLLETVGGYPMLWTLMIVLLALWAFGLAASYTLGGLLHLLLVVALVILVVQLVQGRRVV
jgi:Family of unknown function (DUF5670)